MCVYILVHSHRQSGKLAVRHQNVCNTDIHAHRQHFMNTRKQQIKCVSVCMFVFNKNNSQTRTHTVSVARTACTTKTTWIAMPACMCSKPSKSICMCFFQFSFSLFSFARRNASVCVIAVVVFKKMNGTINIIHTYVCTYILACNRK